MHCSQQKSTSFLEEPQNLQNLVKKIEESGGFGEMRAGPQELGGKKAEPRTSTFAEGGE